MINTPIYRGRLQSDLDTNGFHILGFSPGGGGSGLPEGWVSVKDFGAAADGVTDDTAAAVAAVAAATATVYFPPGKYFFAGSIGEIPPGISLVGAKMFGPHWSVYYSGSSSTDPLLGGGSILLLTANAGNATGPKFISAGTDTAIVGLTFYWPNQVRTNATPIAYPWAIYIHNGNAASVQYCEFVNAYQGIYMEGTQVGGGGGVDDSLIAHIRGEALYRGIKMEGIMAPTLLQDCYFDDQWSRGATIATYRKNNAIAFDMGRNDETFLDNCFCYDYMTWLHCYYDATHGARGPWLQVRGGGADLCLGYCVWIEETQPQGVSLEGVSLTTQGGAATVKIDSTHTGSVRISDSLMLSLFLGNFGLVDGSGEVSVDNCFCFADLAGGTNPFSSPGTTGWAVTGTGNFALRGSNFKTTQTHVSLASTLGHAMVTGNMASGTFTATNGMSTRAVIANNTV